MISAAMPYLELGTYRHYKGGLYDVVAIGMDSETQHYVVIYKSQDELNTYWVRPYDMFIEMVIVDGREKKRFEKI